MVIAGSEGEGMDKGKISIIVPVYNAEKYLPRAIESVICNHYQNWELILVEDFSKDSSGKICDEYALRDERIKVIKKKNNEGALAARNTGLENAVGEYIAYLDADDWIEPTMYVELIDLLETHGADIAEGSFYFDYEDKCIAERNDGKIYEYESVEAIEKLHTRETIADKLWSKIYRRTCIPRFSQEIEIIVGVDYSFLVHIFENCDKVVYVEKPYYHYYQRVGSVCNAGYSEKRKYVVENSIYYREYLCAKYPEIKPTVTARLLFNEMAVLASMAKNGHYDRQVINRVKNEVRMHAKDCRGAKNFNFVMKVSTLLTYVNPYLLIVLYKVKNKFQPTQINV